jgi:hypothetical protein
MTPPSHPAVFGVNVQELDMSEFCGGQPGGKYELFSVMMHTGSAVAGHYFAYIKVCDCVQRCCSIRERCVVAPRIWQARGGTISTTPQLPRSPRTSWDVFLARTLLQHLPLPFQPQVALRTYHNLYQPRPRTRTCWCTVG